jgi:hypothetical protein
MRTDRNRRLTGAVAGPFMTQEAAERHASMLNGWDSTQQRADRDQAQVRKETHGPTYELLASDQKQTGEPRPHGVPAEYGRPSLVEILAGAPRALPVSRALEHGPEESRSEAFDEGRQRVRDLGAMHYTYGLGPGAGLDPWIYQPRKKRYRPSFAGDDEASIPYPPAPAPADLPPEKFQRGW